ncbi:MAG TPA: helix-turn-helix domain-containing protein [Chitinophagaceae bacterium]|nr:helix-turn-helix domain-containing protein [Chitinophagaceae bacterium]
MEFKKIIPAPALQPYVRCYWVFEVNGNDAPFSQLLFPFGSFELIFNLLNAPQMKMAGQQSSFVQPDSLYPGQFTRPFVLSYTQRAKCIGVSLHPWMGKLLFNIPAQEFTDRVTNINTVDDQGSLREKLLDAGTETELIARLEMHLLNKLKSYQPDPVSSLIAKTILCNPTADGFKNIVSSIGFTRRRVEQRFLETTGLPMGFFVRKIRFQKAVALLRHGQQLSLTQIGLEAGYYDQAHFIREFRAFAGLTPSAFLKESSEMKNFVSDLTLLG